MAKKPLSKTNPYLRDAKKARKALIWSVASSTAIETGQPIEAIARALEESLRTNMSSPRNRLCENSEIFPRG